MKVKKFATVVNGATPSSKHAEYYDGDIAWFTPRDLSDQGTKYVSVPERYITQEGYDSCSTTMLPAGSVLMSSRAPIGLIAISTVPCCTNQGFKSFVVDPNKCDSEYLYYYLKYHIKEIEALGSGTTFKEVSKDAVENYEVFLPDVNLQKSIVQILKDIDSKIINNDIICTNLEAMAKLLYDYWFVQFDFPDKNGKPYKSAGGKMVWNDELKREIPEGWEVHPANAYLDIVKGISYTASDLLGDGIKMLNLNSFNEDGSYKVEGIKTFSGNAPNERTLLPNDLIMCATQQTDIDLSGKKNVIGKALLVPDLEETMTFSMDVCKLVTDNKKYLPFFKYQFGLPHAHKYIVGYANGTKIKHLDVANALSLPLAMPGQDSSLIDRFSDFAFSINGKISEIIKENQQLASLRDFLLPMLMNGQVKVGKA